MLRRVAARTSRAWCLFLSQSKQRYFTFRISLVKRSFCITCGLGTPRLDRREYRRRVRCGKLMELCLKRPYTWFSRVPFPCYRLDKWLSNTFSPWLLSGYKINTSLKIRHFLSGPQNIRVDVAWYHWKEQDILNLSIVWEMIYFVIFDPISISWVGIDHSLTLWYYILNSISL